MSESAEMFKKLAKGRLKPAQAPKETKPEPETKPQKETKTSVKEISQEKILEEKIPQKPTPESNQPEAEITPEPTKKRGRPATGKRSDRNWIGRTYYIRKETDLDIEEELILLKRAGIKLDKSSLVDSLLAAWVKWRKGENIDSYLSEISPRQKDELP